MMHFSIFKRVLFSDSCSCASYRTTLLHYITYKYVMHDYFNLRAQYELTLKCFLLNELSQCSTFSAFQQSFKHRRPYYRTSEWNQLCVGAAECQDQAWEFLPPNIAAFRPACAAEMRVSESKKPLAKHPDTLPKHVAWRFPALVIEFTSVLRMFVWKTLKRAGQKRSRVENLSAERFDEHGNG